MAYDSFNPRTTETRLTLPLNGSVFTTTRTVPAGMVLPVMGDTMESQLGPEWSNSRIIQITATPQGGKINLTLVHARIPSEADQLAFNWESSTADIGGTKYPSVQRTCIVLASTYSAVFPASGSAMPFVAGDAFDGQDYRLVNRQVQKGGMQLEPVFKVETRNYVKRSVITSISVDSLNGQTLTNSTAIYYASEEVSGSITMAQLVSTPHASYWGLQDDGMSRSVQQLSAEWYAVSTDQVVGGTFSAGAVSVGSYFTNDNYSWPPVLEYLNILIWPLRSGGDRKQVNMTFNPEGYSGPCKTQVVRTWSKTPWNIPAILPMLPRRINYGCPDFQVNVPECLHGPIAINDDKSNKDHIWKWTTGTEKIFPATNWPNWPDSIISFDDQEPCRGGWLRTTRTTYSPLYSASVIPGKTLDTIDVTGLSPTYTGSALSVSATGHHSETVVVLYNWSSTPPTNAGSYSVLAYINDPIYYGTFSGTLVISQADCLLTIVGTSATYSGSPIAVTTSTTPGGLTVSLTYNGSSTAPTNAGSYSVVAVVNSGNYQGYATGTLTIAKASATVTLSALSQSHTGMALAPTVTTSPAGLSCVITYDGDPTPVSSVGSYAVIATITDTNHSGSASGTFVIT